MWWNDSWRTSFLDRFLEERDQETEYLMNKILVWLLGGSTFGIGGGGPNKRKQGKSASSTGT